MKYCSKDQEVATTFFFLNEDKVSDATNSNEEPSENVKALDFVSCYYDNYWWIGLILEKDDHQKDSRIKSPWAKSIICVALFQGYLLVTKQPHLV